MSNKKLRSFMDIERMKELFSERQDIMELVAKILLQNDELRVKSFEVSSIEEDSLSILINACDDDFEYAIQLYKCDEEITPQKARFLLSWMITNHLDDDSPIQIRLICITDSDVYGLGKPLYHIFWQGVNFKHPLELPEEIIFVNGAYEGDDDIGKLIHDLNCNEANDMYLPILADRAKELSK